MNKIISYVNKNLVDETQKQRFGSIITHALSLTEKKRYYLSNYGYSNSVQSILDPTTTLIPSPSYDKFYLENVIEWWKNKAEKRYNSLIEQSRLRTEIELQSYDLDTIR